MARWKQKELCCVIIWWSNWSCCKNWMHALNSGRERMRRLLREGTKGWTGRYTHIYTKYISHHALNIFWTLHCCNQHRNCTLFDYFDYIFMTWVSANYLLKQFGKPLRIGAGFVFQDFIGIVLVFNKHSRTFLWLCKSGARRGHHIAVLILEPFTWDQEFCMIEKG